MLYRTFVGCRLHFEKLAKFLGYKDVVAFAEKVVYSLPEERRDMLAKFYVDQDSELAPIFKEEEEEEIKVRAKPQRGRPAGKGMSENYI